jgi:DNA polymerase III gamma/tau subunit
MPDLPIQKFSDLIGNKSYITLLQRSTVLDRVAPFTVLAGAFGTGKSSCAKLIALLGTCENPKGNEACLSCDSCRKNIQELDRGGITSNVVKKDMSRVSSLKDIESLVQEVFGYLNGMTGKVFYIFEELQELSLDHQAKLLSSMETLGPNVKVIATTTATNKLLPTLLDRALVYYFDPLGKADSSLLLQKLAKQLNLKMDKTVESLLIKYSKGSARSLSKMITFIKDLSPDLEELRNFVGIIDPAYFINMFELMEGDTVGFMLSLHSLLEKGSPGKILSQFKGFLEEYFLGDKSSELTKEQRTVLDRLLPSVVLDKILTRLDNRDSNISEEDFILMFMRFRSFVLNVPMSSIIKDNEAKAHKDLLDSKESAEIEQSRVIQEKQLNSKIADSSFFKNLREDRGR